MTEPEQLAYATNKTRRRYDRNAPMYDMMEHLMETRAFQRWRQRLWSLVEGEKILEVGVGTGKNMPFYPLEAQVTGIDLSSRMLARAQNRAAELDCEAELCEMDVQELAYPDGSFDGVVSTFVFCSVPDSIAGLCEIKRVLRPNGKIYMLEHVLSGKSVLRQLMNLVNPLVVRATGVNINRETRENLGLAGFSVMRAEPLWSDIFWLFVAEGPGPTT